MCSTMFWVEIKSTIYMCKQRGLFSGMAEWINLPSNPGSATVSEVLPQKFESQRMFVNDGIVVCGSLIIHRPTSQDKLQSSC